MDQDVKLSPTEQGILVALTHMARAIGALATIAPGARDDLIGVAEQELSHISDASARLGMEAVLAGLKTRSQ